MVTVFLLLLGPEFYVTSGVESRSAKFGQLVIAINAMSIFRLSWFIIIQARMSATSSAWSGSPAARTGFWPPSWGTAG